MKDKIPVKESPQTLNHEREVTKRLELEMCGIYSPAYDWANYKKNLGKHMLSKNSHKAFLRKNRLGKFAKGK